MQPFRAFCTLIFYARSLLLTLLVLRPPLPGDNAVKIILVTRHATCRCNFAAISNFLDSLALPVLPIPRALFRSRKRDEDAEIGREERSKRKESYRSERKKTRTLRRIYSVPFNKRIFGKVFIIRLFYFKCLNKFDIQTFRNKICFKYI